MESNTPLQLKPGQRALAAIVFTDVVSFSALMQRDEVGTLRRLERDFATMRAMCAQHEGAVLKTTGDGLLLYFSSAVQAVACALALQRHFAEQKKTLPEGEALTHRLGIHLGDVFIGEQDVMGDGVNIAARIQSEAEPGGICISQTVYDVVKNKLTLHVTNLGPRELKNITQSIPIYRLLLEAQTLESGHRIDPPAPEPATAAPPPAPAKPTSWKKQVALAVGLAVLGVIITKLASRAIHAQKRDEAQIAAAQTAIGAMLEEEPPAEPGKPGLPRQRIGRVLAEWRAELLRDRVRAYEEMNFPALANRLNDSRATTGVDPADLLIRRSSLARMAAMRNWMLAALAAYSKERPLAVRELTGTAPKEIRVYAGPDRRIYTLEGGAVRQRDLSTLKPALVGAVLVAVLRDTRTPPPRDVVQGVAAFAQFYGLPEVLENLRAPKPRAR
jgi:class 3 adenylate cyclase